MSAWGEICAHAVNKVKRMRRKHFCLAFCSLTVALEVLLAWLVTIFPLADLTIFAVMSALICIVLSEFSFRYALLTVLATDLIISFFPGFPLVWPFIAFWGIYPFIKAGIEKFFKQKRLPYAATLLPKLLIVGLLGVLSVFLAVKILGIDYHAYLTISEKIPFAVGLILMALLALLIDYVMTVLLAFWRERLRPHFPKE